MTIKLTPGSIEAGKDDHVVLTGPIQVPVTLADGEVVDVRPQAILARNPDHALAIANAIGEYWSDPNTPDHPDHIEVQDDGNVRVVEFNHNAAQSEKNLRTALKGK